MLGAKRDGGGGWVLRDSALSFMATATGEVIIIFSCNEVLITSDWCEGGTGSESYSH